MSKRRLHRLRKWAWVFSLCQICEKVTDIMVPAHIDTFIICPDCIRQAQYTFTVHSS